MEMWRSQNEVYGWARYARGLAAVNSWQVKGQLPPGQPHPQAELFLPLPPQERQSLVGRFWRGVLLRKIYPGATQAPPFKQSQALQKLNRYWAGAKRRLKMGLRPLAILAQPGKWYSDAGPDFLVVGLQKCGTYWVTNLLMNHPEASCQPTQPDGDDRVREGHFFDVLGTLENDQEFFLQRMLYKHQRFFADLAEPTLNATGPARAAALAKLCRRYNAFVRNNAKPGARLVGEKTPEYVFHCDLIAQLYPKAKLICILRHPRDRIVSFHHHQIRKGRWSHPDIEDWEVEQYCQRVEREYLCLLACQQDLHLITYEQLSRQGQETVAGMCRFLGLSSDAGVVEQMLQQARFDRLAKSNPGVGNPHQHFRKGKVGEGKKRLSKNQQEMVAQRLRGLTTRLAQRYGLDLEEYLQ